MISPYGSDDPMIVAAQDLLTDRAIGMTIVRKRQRLYVEFDEPVKLEAGSNRKYWIIPCP